jgi:hypothetical protein
VALVEELVARRVEGVDRHQHSRELDITRARRPIQHREAFNKGNSTTLKRASDHADLVAAFSSFASIAIIGASI